MIITKEGFAVLERDSHLSRWIEETGRIDHNEDVVNKVCKYFNEGDHVLDIGASLGDHTVPYARRVGRVGKVYAFEPQPESFDCLKFNVRHYPQVQIFNFALGEADGEMKWINRDDNVGASRVIEEPDGRDEVTMIEVRTLDSIHFPRLDFIKIDTEGYDLFVMRGGIETIRKHRPKIMFELSGCSLKYYGLKTEDFTGFIDTIGYTATPPIELEDGLQMDTLLLPK